MKNQLTGAIALFCGLLALSTFPAEGQATVGTGTLDPATGLPTEEQWLSSDWKGPSGIISNISYESLPVTEVANQLRTQFNGAFDIIIPNTWKSPNNPDVSFDPSTVNVQLILNNVRPFELFNAMNLEFEAENKPVRWELKNNIERPMAVLRVVPNLVPGVISQGPVILPPQKKSIVYFVGDLLDAGGSARGPSGGSPPSKIDKLFFTIWTTYDLAYHSHEGELQLNPDAELIVVTATPDKIAFVQSILSGLRDKQRWDDLKPTRPTNTNSAPESNK